MSKAKNIFLKNRVIYKWGTYGKFMEHKYPIYIPYRELSDKHIINILRTQNHLGRKHKWLLLSELLFRLQNNKHRITEDNVTY